jgi:hypothetical protein
VIIIACSNTSAPLSQETAPPASEPAPEPGANDVILLQDDFNRPTVAAQLAPYASAGAFTRVTDGHSGEALRVSYQSSSWNTNTIDRALSSVATDAYYRYWYRLSSGADVSCGGKNSSGFKWFMTHRPGDVAPRYTHGVTRLPGGPRGFENVGLEFSTHDVSSTREPNPFQSNINKSKRFNTTNDGQWHEYTLHVVTGNSGYEQIWVDGVKVLDSKGFGYDHSAVGIESISFPGTMVQWFSGCEFTIDVDDLVVWHK